MIHEQMQTSKVMMAPVSVATDATETGIAVDCKGYDYASIDILLDTTAAASNNPVKCLLAEGDVTTIGTAIAAFTGDDTTNGFTIPNSGTSTPTVVRFNVNLKPRKRYLSVHLTAGTAAQLCAVGCRLSRRHEAYTPSGPSDADLGCAEIVNG